MNDKWEKWMDLLVVIGVCAAWVGLLAVATIMLLLWTLMT